MKKSLTLITLLAVLLSGCKMPATSQADIAAANTQTTPAQSSTSSEAPQTSTSMQQGTKPLDVKPMKMETDALNAALQPGTAYADAREALFKLGWKLRLPLIALQI